MKTATLLCTATLAGAAALAVVTGAHAQTTQEVIDRTQVAGDWVAGKYADRDFAITYDGDPITLNLSSHLPEVSGIPKMLKQAIPLLEKMSKGKLKISARYGGTVHSVSEGLDAIRSGITDIAACFVFLHPTNFPMTQALALPNAFPNGSVQNIVAERLAPKYFIDEFTRQGVYLFGIVGTPEFNLFTRTPITTLEELKGKKIRSGGGLNESVFVALGAATVNMSSRDFYSGLQRGLLDGIFTHDSAGKSFRLVEIATDHTATSLNRAPLEWCLNPRTYNALPADLKKVFDAWARAQTMVQTQYVQMREAAVGRDQFIAAGMKMHSLSPEQQKLWQEAAQPAVEEYFAEQEKAGRPVRALNSDMQALVAEYSKKTLDEIMLETIENPSPDFFPSGN